MKTIFSGLVVLLLGVPVASWSQGKFLADMPAAERDALVNRDITVALLFNNAPLEQLLTYYAEVAGKRIVADEGVTIPSSGSSVCHVLGRIPPD